MKKLLAILLAAILCVGLMAGCGQTTIIVNMGGEDEAEETPDATDAPANTPQPAAPPAPRRAPPPPPTGGLRRPPGKLLRDLLIIFCLLLVDK